jgi:TP901 family phage tail tape measure protein
MALRIDEWRLKMTENVQRTLAQLSGASDKVAAKFARGQALMQRGISQAGSMFTEFKENLLSSLPIPPQMATALGALTGPLGIAIGLSAALTLGLMKGVQAAEQFAIPFRELRNLNLDKSAEEIEALNDSLLKLSFDKGLDAQAITKGYYDIQSATGLYGQEVLDMTGRIGEASRALNMDYSAAVNGATKAMLAYKLGAADVDSIMESNAKTVQVGVVNFDDLARSQTEYMGSAAAMKQTLNTSNKVFAALTQSTKDANVAATMTKGAFQDLSKASTVEGLKKIGVSIFDAAGGFRQADEVLKDLVPALAELTDQDYAALKEEIGGSEGLRGLLDQAKGSGDNLLRTMDAFDASKFDVNKAIAQANGDLDVMKDKLSNQLNAAFIQLGQAVMPLATAMVGMLLDAANGMRNLVGWVKGLYDSTLMIRVLWETIFILLKVGWEAVVAAVKVPMNMVITIAKATAEILTGNFSQAWDTIKQGGYDVAQNLKGLGSGVGDAFTSAFSNIAGPDVKANVALTPPAKKAMEAATAGVVVPGAMGAGGKNTTTGTGAATGVKQGVTEVVGGGKQVRNVTVNIQSLVKELVVHSGSVREGAVDIQRQVTDALVRAVNGGELALAND